MFSYLLLYSFVGNFVTGTILKISSGGSIELLATFPTVQEGVVIGYITHFDGTIYATAPGEHVIYSVSMSGGARILARSGEKESKDGPLLGASFNTPNGIAADPNKKVVYVTEGGGNNGGALRVNQFRVEVSKNRASQSIERTPLKFCSLLAVVFYNTSTSSILFPQVS